MQQRRSSSNHRVDQEILEILRDKGEIDEAKYQELKTREQLGHDKSYTIKYKNAFSISRNDGSAENNRT